MPKFCGECGTKCAENWVFCGECGYAFQAPAETPTSSAPTSSQPSPGPPPPPPEALSRNVSPSSSTPRFQANVEHRSQFTRAFNGSQSSNNSGRSGGGVRYGGDPRECAICEASFAETKVYSCSKCRKFICGECCENAKSNPVCNVCYEMEFVRAGVSFTSVPRREYAKQPGIKVTRNPIRKGDSIYSRLGL